MFGRAQSCDCVFFVVTVLHAYCSFHFCSINYKRASDYELLIGGFVRGQKAGEKDLCY